MNSLRARPDVAGHTLHRSIRIVAGHKGKDQDSESDFLPSTEHGAHRNQHMRHGTTTQAAVSASLSPSFDEHSSQVKRSWPNLSMKNFSFFELLEGVHILLSCFLCSRIFSAVFRRSCMDFSRTIWNFFQSPDLSENSAISWWGNFPALRLQPQGGGVRALRTGTKPRHAAPLAAAQPRRRRSAAPGT